jgi:hypothetical protein
MTFHVIRDLGYIGPLPFSDKVEPILRGPGPRCAVCSSFIGGKEWLNPKRIRFEVGTRSRSRPGDVVFGSGALFLASYRFRYEFETAKLKGLGRWDEVEIVGKAQGRYFHPVLAGRTVRCRLAGRVSWVEEPNCEVCGNGLKEAIRGIDVDQTSWNGEDLFVPLNLPGTIVVSPRFAAWANKHAFTNLELVPAFEFSWPSA